MRSFLRGTAWIFMGQMLGAIVMALSIGRFSETQVWIGLTLIAVVGILLSMLLQSDEGLNFFMGLALHVGVSFFGQRYMEVEVSVRQQVFKAVFFGLVMLVLFFLGRNKNTKENKESS